MAAKSKAIEFVLNQDAEIARNHAAVLVGMFAAMTNGSVHYARGTSIEYIYYAPNTINNKIALYIWVMPYAESLFGSISGRARLENQRRSIIERASVHPAQGYHAMLIVPNTVEYKKGTVEWIQLSMNSAGEILINSFEGIERQEEFQAFINRIFSVTEIEMISKMATGNFII